MKAILISFLILTSMLSIDAQQVIKLYEGNVPGNKGIPDNEKITYTKEGEIQTITGVIDPSVTVYLPDPEKATGTAVIICAGGSLRMLGWKNDVLDMAKWLNSKGIAAIGLKYRLRTDDPAAAAVAGNSSARPPSAVVTEFGKFKNANGNPDTSFSSMDIIDKSINDAMQAMRIVRQHAAEWHINPEKVGYLGFSAGGGVAFGATIRADEKTMPNFVVSAYGPSLIDVVVPENAPKIFIATRADHANVAAACLALFLEWKKAGVSAELHMYDDKTGGFGGEYPGTENGRWTESFYSWLVATGY